MNLAQQIDRGAFCVSPYNDAWGLKGKIRGVQGWTDICRPNDIPILPARHLAPMSHLSHMSHVPLTALNRCQGVTHSTTSLHLNNQVKTEIITSDPKFNRTILRLRITNLQQNKTYWRKIIQNKTKKDEQQKRIGFFV